MTNTSTVINDILIQLSNIIEEKYIQQVKMILFMNLCNYVLQENITALVKSQDNTNLIIEKWLQELILEGCTRSTVYAYKSEILNFLRHSECDVKEAEENHIRKYLAYGKIVKHWKDATYNTKVRSLRSFFTWAYREDYINKNPMKKIKETKMEYRIGQTFSAEQRELIRCACCSERELAIVDLLYSSGARISEICQLNRDNIDFTNRRAVIYGKGKKEREILFSEQAKVHILAYLDQRTDCDCALFVSEKKPHNRMTDDGIRYILKTIQSRDHRLYGIKITPHAFRRTCGTDMINHGAPAEMVKEKLGHNSVNTTLQCYAKISRETAREAERRYCIA